MAGLGPFALLWVGMSTFLMSAKSGNVLVAANSVLWMWGIIYPVINILLIIMHYHLSPPMYAWLAIAPVKKNPIDSAVPWSAPAGTVGGSSVGNQLSKKQKENSTVINANVNF